MEMKRILIYIDLMGFEKKAMDDAEKTNRPIEDIRDSYRNSIKIRLKELKNKKTIVHFQPMSLDSWLLFSNDFCRAFKSIGEVLKAKLPLEIAIEIKEFNKSIEGDLIVLSNETISYIKNYIENDIIKQYKNWYKKVYKESPVTTFILFTAEAYEEFEFKWMCYKPYPSAEFYLVKHKNFEETYGFIEFFEEMAPQRKEYRTIDVDWTNYLIYAKESITSHLLHQRILNGIEYLYKVKSPEGGWGPTPNTKFRILNTCEVISGILNSPNLREEDKDQIYIALNKIFINGCNDGGFPSKTYDTFTSKCSSTTECTSWVVYTCLSYQRVFDEMGVQVDDKIHNAVEWLKSNFDENGGGWGLWLGEYVRLYPTLWAMMALNSCKSISDTDYKKYFESVINLHSSNDRCLFGFYPNSTANIPMSSLFLILINNINKKRNNLYIKYKDIFKKYETKIIDYIFSEEKKFLWEEKEEIKHHRTVQAKDGGYIKFQFTHFSSCYSIIALYRYLDRLNDYQKIRLKISLAMLLSLQDDGKFKMVNTSIPTDYTFITALSLYALGCVFKSQDEVK